jgi:hypothetical protein
VRFAVVLLVVCIIGWPLTAATVFSEEPPGILGLSWLAIILQAVEILLTTDVRDTQKGDT